MPSPWCRELQSHGIRVLGSTIIGLENHSRENIDQVIDYAVRYRTDFHQFMLYTPVPGTPLHAQLSAEHRMKDEGECHPGDIHGQLMFNYHHPHIKNGEEGEFVLRAFQRDFEVNGPSVTRIVRTSLAGWKRYKNDPDPRIRRRFAEDVHGLSTSFSALLGEARRYYRNSPTLRAEMSATLRELHREFGWKSRLYSALGGPYILWKLRGEQPPRSRLDVRAAKLLRNQQCADHSFRPGPPGAHTVLLCVARRRATSSGRKHRRR